MTFSYICRDCGERYEQGEHSEDERCPDCREGVVDL